MKLDMDCPDKYYNLQPSTNYHSKHFVYYKSEALQSAANPPPPLYLCDTPFLTKHFAFLNGF